MTEYEKLNLELRNAGVPDHEFMGKKGEPIDTLVNTKLPAKPFKSILIKYLDLLKSNELEMVIRALSEKGMKDVSPRLIKFLNTKENHPNLNLWTVGCSISIIDDKATYEDVLKICQTSEFGASREMLMTTLRKIKTEESFKTLLDSLQDESIRGHAINELRKWGDPRALEQIENTEVRKGLFEEKARKKAIEKLKTDAKIEKQTENIKKEKTKLLLIIKLIRKIWEK